MTFSNLDLLRRPALPAGKGLVTRRMWERWLRIILGLAGVGLVIEGVQRAQERDTKTVYRSPSRAPLVKMVEVRAAIAWMQQQGLFTLPEGAVNDSAEEGLGNPGGLRFTGLLTKPKLRILVPWLLARIEMRFENVDGYRVA